MSGAPEPGSFLQIDRLLHEPARLLILSILVGAESVEFRFVEQISGLSKGNLSSHMSKLEAAGLIAISKSFRGKHPLTTLRITPLGRQSLSAYRVQLEKLVSNIPQTPPAD